MKKLFWFLFSLPFMLLPTELFILFWLILKPVTFWQKLMSIIFGTVFLCPIQSILFIAWLAFLNELFISFDQESRRKKYIKSKQEAAQKNRIEEFL